MLLTGAAAGLPATVIGGRRYVRTAGIAGNSRMKLSSGLSNRKYAEYRGNGHSFAVNTDSRIASIDGMRVEAAYPARCLWGRFFISEADYLFTFNPLLAPWTAKKHPVRRIVIDAGHGGKDRGASGRVSVEKNITLSLALRTAQILNSCGYKAVLTRSRDQYVDLEKRAGIQRLAGGDLFVSIHVNSAVRPVSGIETFCLTPAGTPSSGKNTVTYQKDPGNAFDANNILLAARLHKALLRRTQAEDRGLKRARFVVLRQINCPGVLLEVGFISNASEEIRLGQAAYREQLARGIAEGIIMYHRAVLPPKPVKKASPAPRVGTAPAKNAKTVQRNKKVLK